MKKILILLFSTSFSATSTPIIAETISTHRIENGHIIDNKFSLSSFDMEHFDSILSKSMSNDEKLEKIVHDGINGLKNQDFKPDYGIFDSSFNEIPQTFQVKYNTCNLDDNYKHDCSLSIYAKAENQLFSGVINLDVTVKYDVIVDWSALNNLLVSLDLNISSENPTINDIKNKQDVIYKKINDEINQIENTNVFYDAFNSLKWNITYPDRILSDNNGIYKINQINFSAVGNNEYRDATFNINLVVYVIRDNVKYYENYNDTLSESANWSNKNENFSESGYLKIVDITKLNENQGNNTIFDNFSKLKINFDLDNNLRYWDYDNNLVGQINSVNLEMSNIKNSLNEKNTIDIINDSSHSGLAYWEVQISVIFKIQNNVLYVNFKNRVKIKIISSKVHTVKLQYGVDNLEFLR